MRKTIVEQTLLHYNGMFVSPFQLLTSKQGPAFMDFSQWGQADNDNTIAVIRNLRGAVARLPESEGNKARLRLARFLLARRLAPEALGEIQLIQAADAKLASDRDAPVGNPIVQDLNLLGIDSRVELTRLLGAGSGVVTPAQQLVLPTV